MTGDDEPGVSRTQICRNCWWRRATPGFATCTFCFHTPHKHRANAAWADLIAQVDAELAAAADTTTDNPRKAA